MQLAREGHILLEEDKVTAHVTSVTTAFVQPTASKEIVGEIKFIEFDAVKVGVMDPSSP